MDKESAHHREIKDDYLEMLRRQDHRELRQEIQERFDEILNELSRLSDLDNIVGEIQRLLQDEHDVAEKVESLSRILLHRVLAGVPLGLRSLKDVPLLGRDADVRALLAKDGDIVLSGQPGSGKTFLLYHLASIWGGQFVISQDIDGVLRFLEVDCPALLILDDVTERLPLAERLFHWRKTSEREFRVVVVCWPFESDKVLNTLHLSKRTIFELPLLPSDTIASLIEQRFKIADLTPRIDIVREIRRQADGRPGLAIDLTDAVLEETSTRALLEGDVYWRLTRGAYERVGGEDTDVILAGFSVGGSDGIIKESVSQVFGIPLHRMQAILKGLAAGGIVEEIGLTTIATRPAACRYTLLDRTFFRGPGRGLQAQYWALYDAAPNKTSALFTLVEAMRRGAPVDPEKVRIEVRKQGIPEVWRRVAWTNEEWCKWVMQESPEAVLEQADVGLAYLPEKTIPLLLNDAVDDARAEKFYRTSPLRQIEDWLVRDRDNNNPAAAERRKVLMESVINWGKNGDDTVTWRILPKCLTLRSEYSECDAGEGTTFYMSQTLISLENAKQISTLWPTLLSYVAERPPQEWSPIKDVLMEWLFPHAAHASLNTEYRQFTKKTAKEVSGELLQIPSVPRNALARWMIENTVFFGEDANEIPIDPDYLAFCPPDPFRTSDDYDQARSEFDMRAINAGREWSKQPPVIVADRLNRFMKEYRLFETRGTTSSYVLCRTIAEEVEDVLSWTTTFSEKRVDPQFIAPFLQEAIRRSPPLCVPWFQAALDDEAYQSLAMQFVIQFEEVPISLLDDYWELLAESAEWVTIMAFRGDIPLSRLEAVLEHSDAALSLKIALADFRSDRQILVTRNRPLWIKSLRKGMKEYSIRDLGDLYDIGKLLEEVSELANDVVRSVAASSDHVAYCDDAPSTSVLRTIIDSLSIDGRVELLQCLDDRRNTVLAGLLVGDDLDVYRALLENPKLKHVHLGPLQETPSSVGWVAKARLAMEFGYLPDDIVAAVCQCYRFLSGNDDWNYWADKFESLAESSDKGLHSIGEIGVELVRQERDHEAWRKRREKLFGRYDE
ncbi:MAG: hypothetical protein JW818_10715 [Pirellulales bacterium]|nr:hypothetical protein [Pirellulales bacterium]